MYLSITTALLNITKGSNPPIIPHPPPPHYSGVESSVYILIKEQIYKLI